jgi:hypothetical protein
MADFAIWATAAEEALGWPRGAFITAYKHNLDTGAFDILDNDVVGTTILEMLEHTPIWEGTAKDLLEAIEQRTWNPDGRAVKLPATPRALANELQRRASVLARAGVRVERPTRGKARIIVLRRLTAGNGRVSSEGADV